jgi:hypothetical protein
MELAFPARSWDVIFANSNVNEMFERFLIECNKACHDLVPLKRQKSTRISPVWMNKDIKKMVA